VNVMNQIWLADVSWKTTLLNGADMLIVLEGDPWRMVG
jgi:hypothetical protein